MDTVTYTHTHTTHSPQREAEGTRTGFPTPGAPALGVQQPRSKSHGAVFLPLFFDQIANSTTLKLSPTA